MRYTIFFSESNYEKSIPRSISGKFSVMFHISMSFSLMYSFDSFLSKSSIMRECFHGAVNCLFSSSKIKIVLIPLVILPICSMGSSADEAFRCSREVFHSFLSYFFDAINFFKGFNDKTLLMDV